MSKLYENILQLCNSKGITGYRLCKDTGLSPGTLTDLKMGRKKGLSAENAQKVADYFGVTVRYLLSGDDSLVLSAPDLQLFAGDVPTQKEKPTAESSEPTDEDYQIIKQFVLDANPDERADVRQYIEFIKSKRK